MKRCSACGIFAPGDARVCARCGGESFAAEAVDLVDGRYAIEESIGAGGMGEVYRARDVWLDRQVALKFIGQRQQRRSTGPKAHFQREAAALASVRNEHVVQVYAFGPYEASFFLAMEFVRGRSLEAIVREHTSHGESVPVSRLVTIVEQVARGLGAVHRAGLVHLDVKPGNIVIEEDTGRPVLIDFGLARWRFSNSVPPVLSGTPCYMAPERCDPDAEPRPLTPEADIYALGCVLFEVLTGAPPFDAVIKYAVFAQHLDAPIPKVSATRPELAAFDAIVEKAMAKVPADRFRTCEEFADALAAAVPPPGAMSAPSLVLSDPPPPVSSGGAPLRVLVVDDDPVFQRLAGRAIEIAFEGAKLSLRAVASGSEAVRLARRGPPDLMTLDFDLPGVDGIETLSQIRALPMGTHTRVVVVSGGAGRAERWRFAVLGVSEFLEKPVDMGELVETLRRVGQRAGLGAMLSEPDTVDAAAQPAESESPSAARPDVVMVPPPPRLPSIPPAQESRETRETPAPAAPVPRPAALAQRRAPRGRLLVGAVVAVVATAIGWFAYTVAPSLASSPSPSRGTDAATAGDRAAAQGQVEPVGRQ